MSVIYGNPSGGFGMPKVIELTDENGNTLLGTVTDSEVNLDATRRDVRIGKKFASNEGICEGENTITYRTEQGRCLIFPESDFSIPLPQYDKYDYTGFQCIIVQYNTSINDSVCADRVVINDNVYAVNSIESLSVVTKNQDTKSIDLNIVNNTDNTYLILYFVYREEL